MGEFLWNIYKGYTLARILSQVSFVPFLKQKIFPIVRSPECKIKKEISKSTLNTENFNPIINLKSNKFDKYSHDESGSVTVYTDAATRGKDESERNAGSYWHAVSAKSSF